MSNSDYYHKKIVEYLEVDDTYSDDDVVFLIQDCEGYLSVELAEGYTHHTCACGCDSKWEIKYIGTKGEILREVKYHLLEHEYN